MKTIIVSLILSLIYFTVANATECIISSDDENKLLAMSFDQFDQSKEGWRQFSACYQQTSTLIDRYTNQNEITLEAWQKRILLWHAGQLYAFNNNYEMARQRFLSAVDPTESANSPIRWNDYVYATIAFIDKDLNKLMYYREEIARSPEWNGEKVNLKVVDSLIKNFDKPYSAAYGQ